MKIEIPIKKRYELPNLLIPEEITAKDVRKAYGRGYEEGVIQASLRAYELGKEHGYARGYEDGYNDGCMDLIEVEGYEEAKDGEILCEEE